MELLRNKSKRMTQQLIGSGQRQYVQLGGKAAASMNKQTDRQITKLGERRQERKMINKTKQGGEASHPYLI